MGPQEETEPVDDCDLQDGKDAQSEFKKPQILIGKIGKLPRKATALVDDKAPAGVVKPEIETKEVGIVAPPEKSTDKSLPFTYKEPKWSGAPMKGKDYKLEVLKSGCIIDTIDITTRPFHVFGRLTDCDVVMAHPTISRYHMVLQFKALESDERPCGYYMYDLGSTHGSYLNKIRLKPGHYVRVMVGHMFKLGTSSRNFILQGPEEDEEEESELSLTDLKLKKASELEERMRKALEAKEERERIRLEEEKKVQEAGASWGMGDDAEEESDLSENPYAATTNEELYLTDPKKTLRGFFEREGANLEYDCQERGVGQFVCRVELPLDDAHGRAITVEVIHKGKKKEAVVQCALEACRTIDRHGLLRQAKHESRKRKEKDWMSEDFYDSDEDTFLDRTGRVEEKRQKRMAKYSANHSDASRETSEDVLTYDGLNATVQETKTNISALEERLAASRSRLKAAQNQAADGDELDAYIASLSKGGCNMSQKAEISKIKLEIQTLKSKLAKVERLAEIAKPASLPELVKTPEERTDTQEAIFKKTSDSVVYGKRMKFKNTARVDVTSKTEDTNRKTDAEFTEEVDSDEETSKTDHRIKDLEPNEELNVDSEHRNTKQINENDTSHSLNQKKALEAEPIENCQPVGAKTNQGTNESRVFGPMRPPENYVIPESYFDEDSDRDLPEIVAEE